jgi:hypothetical protein
MFDLTQKKNKFILGGCIIIVLVALFYLHEYYTKKLIHNEIKKIARMKKKRSSRASKNKVDEIETFQSEEKELNQQDMDSYIDPGAEYIEDNNSNNNSHSSSRLNPSNIMMRDMMDNMQ